MSFSSLVSNLKDYPHIQKRLEIIWGTMECRKYLKSLCVIDREDRKGFPFEIIQTFVDLISLHDSAFPQYMPNIQIWNEH